jgi:hypothetical protein
VPTAPGRYQFLQEVSDLDLQFALHAVSTKAVAEAG